MATAPASVLITTDETQALPEIIKNLEALGFHIIRKMEQTGIVQGEIPLSRIDTLRNVKGVAKVELSRRVHVSPPDSEIQ